MGLLLIPQTDGLHDTLAHTGSPSYWARHYGDVWPISEVLVWASGPTFVMALSNSYIWAKYGLVFFAIENNNVNQQNNVNAKSYKKLLTFCLKQRNTGRQVVVHYY